jgi:hypothetical protein
MTTTKTQRDYIYNVAEQFQMMMLDAQRRMKNALYDYIEVLQEGIGYVPFDEDYCPTFEDSTTNETQHIFGVRIIKDEDGFRKLQMYTDDYPYEKMNAPLSGWFNPYMYGKFDEGELLNYLKELDDKNNE